MPHVGMKYLDMR